MFYQHNSAKIIKIKMHPECMGPARSKFVYLKTLCLTSMNLKFMNLKPSSFKLTLGLSLLLSSSSGFLYAEVIGPDKWSVNDVADNSKQLAFTLQNADEFASPPPGPYQPSANAMSVDSTAILNEAVTDAEMQMPVMQKSVDQKSAGQKSVSPAISEQQETAIDNAPMQTYSPDTPWPEEKETTVMKKNPLNASAENSQAVTGQASGNQMSGSQMPEGQMQAPVSTQSKPSRSSYTYNDTAPNFVRPNEAGGNSRRTSIPPPPPGPYRAVQKFMPSYNNPGFAQPAYNNYGYNRPGYYVPNQNTYGMQNPAPTMNMPYSQMRNPTYLGPNYSYGYPNQMMNDYGNFDQGGFKQNNMYRNNLNQNDLHQGNINRQPQNLSGSK